MNEKVIARNIVAAYMAKEGDFIRRHFEGLTDGQAKQMAGLMAVLMLKNEMANL